MSERNQPVVVVGVDGSDISIEALKWAEQYAFDRNAKLKVITGFDIPWTIYITPTTTEADYERFAQEKLDETVQQALGETYRVPVDARVVQSRPQIALMVAAQGADLLVVGSHGYEALPNRHLGSVASYCTHHAPCPVVIYRTEP